MEGRGGSDIKPVGYAAQADLSGLSTSRYARYAETIDYSKKQWFICNKRLAKVGHNRKRKCYFCEMAVCKECSQWVEKHYSSQRFERMCDICYREMCKDQINPDVIMQLNTGEEKVLDSEDHVRNERVKLHQENNMLNKLREDYTMKQKQQQDEEDEMHRIIEQRGIDTEQNIIQLEEVKLKAKKLDDEIKGSQSLTDRVKKELENTEIENKGEKNKVADLKRQLEEKKQENKAMEQRLRELEGERARKRRERAPLQQQEDGGKACSCELF